MGLQEVEPMTQMIEIAQRLRLARAARRRFLLLWELDRELELAPHRNRARTKSRIKSIDLSFRQLRLFDDL